MSFKTTSGTNEKYRLHKGGLIRDARPTNSISKLIASIAPVIAAFALLWLAYNVRALHVHVSYEKPAVCIGRQYV